MKQGRADCLMSPETKNLRHTYRVFVDHGRKVVTKCEIEVDDRRIVKGLELLWFLIALDFLKVDGWVDMSAQLLNFDVRD